MPTAAPDRSQPAAEKVNGTDPGELPANVREQLAGIHARKRIPV